MTYIVISLCYATAMQYTSIKYRYALDDELVIDIRSDEVPRKEYCCLSCGSVLVPVLGDVRQKHFRHKTQIDCSSETYLHNLAKRVFYQTYSDCLADNSPFIFEYKVPVQCNACNDHGPCDVGFEFKRTDLTKHFSKIELEARDGEFIPDILLKNAKEQLYVEIAVTHFVEQNKAESGIRIIEINVSNESDIDLITSCCLSETDHRICVKNLNPVPAFKRQTSNCSKTVVSFVLYSNGKSWLGQVSVPEFEKLTRSPGVYVEKMSRYGADAFVSKIGELFQKGIKIRNCWLCESHCLRYRTLDSYCMTLKTPIENNNRAVECPKFRAKKTIPECGLIQEAEVRANRSRPVTVVKVQPLRPPPKYTVTLHGQSHICSECGSDMMFVMSATFNSSSAHQGHPKRYHFVTDGPCYARSMLDRILTATQFIQPDKPGSEPQVDLIIGNLVRSKDPSQRSYYIQCPNCQKLQMVVSNNEWHLCYGEIDFNVYKEVFGI